MKKYFLFVAVLTSNLAIAQHTADTVSATQPVLDEVQAPIPPPVPEPVGADTTYELGALEELPQFPGGEQALMSYLVKNIRYPADAMEADIQGRVFVEFIVGEDGNVSDVTLKRGAHSSLDMEAVRVVKTLPAFAPGRMLGKPVKVRYVLPINFKLK